MHWDSWVTALRKSWRFFRHEVRERAACCSCAWNTRTCANPRTLFADRLPRHSGRTRSARREDRHQRIGFPRLVRDDDEPPHRVKSFEASAALAYRTKKKSLSLVYEARTTGALREAREPGVPVERFECLDGRVRVVDLLRADRAEPIHGQSRSRTLGRDRSARRARGSM